MGYRVSQVGCYVAHRQDLERALCFEKTLLLKTSIYTVLERFTAARHAVGESTCGVRSANGWNHNINAHNLRSATTAAAICHNYLCHTSKSGGRAAERPQNDLQVIRKGSANE